MQIMQGPYHSGNLIRRALNSPQRAEKRTEFIFQDATQATKFNSPQVLFNFEFPLTTDQDGASSRTFTSFAVFRWTVRWSVDDD